MSRKALICATTDSLTEMRDLVASLGYVVLGEELQARDTPDPRTFLGKGRIETLATELKEHRLEPDVIVVAGELKPSQVILLERKFKLPVFDRTRLILEIFRDRAHSEAAKLQVELAQLHYELPVMREAIHRGKTGERPGFLGGGATAFATHIEPVRSRMAEIRRELERIRQERGLRRKHRAREGFWQVSLAGYTNAGKSTLLNAITGADEVAEDRLFSTLETRTRRLKGSRGRSRVLLTDTVGFIEGLPPWLVEAFHATLEEIALADLVLLVVDGSEALPEVRRKVHTSLDVLRGFLAGRERPELAENIFLVFNKLDRAPPGRDWSALAAEWGFDVRHAEVSALTGDGLEAMLLRVRGAISDRRVVAIELPPSGETSALLGRLSQIGELEEVRETERVRIRVAMPRAQIDRVRVEVLGMGGTLVESSNLQDPRPP